MQLHSFSAYLILIQYLFKNGWEELDYENRLQEGNRFIFVLVLAVAGEAT